MPKQKSDNSLKKFYCVALPIVLLGLFFRFANLEARVFWVDEVATAVRVSGYTMGEVTANLAAKEKIVAEELLNYQFRHSDLQTTWRALVQSPEHAPLYFLLTRIWLNLTGSSITAMRTLAAVFSLLVFPALFWLLQELFACEVVSWLGVMLMSLSPFFVAYAQEARPYSLWTATVLLLSASLLRAVRINSACTWIGYIFSLALAFYTSLLSLFVAIAQGFYILVKYRKKLPIVTGYLASNAIALLLFSPWLYVLLTKTSTLENNTTWMRDSIDFSALVATWIGTVLLIFGDLPLSPSVDAIQMAIFILVVCSLLCFGFLVARHWHTLSQTGQNTVYLGVFLLSSSGAVLLAFKEISLDVVALVGGIVAIAIFTLVGYSFYFLVKTTDSHRWLFVGCLLAAIPLPLLGKDLIFQGQSSGAPRYLIPTQLAIQIAAAYTLGTKLRQSFGSYRKLTAGLVVVFFVALGIFSCTRNLNLSPIYLKSRNVHNNAIAAIINRQTQSLIFLESETVGDILSLSHSLNPMTEIKILSDNPSFGFCQRKRSCYILKPSLDLKKKLMRSNVEMKLAYQPKLFTSKQIFLDLWFIASKN